MTITKMLAVTRAAGAAVRRRVNRSAMTELLLTISGGNRDVLRDAPKERTKQVAMGAVLVSTAAIAAVSATYALYLALHLPVPFAVLGGAAWGLIILNLDRWLVVSTPRLKTKWGTLAMALPRVLLAVLIGAVISTPLTLAIFSAEINVEVKKMASETENDFNTQLKSDSRYAQIPDWEKQIEGLQGDLQDGVTDADVNADPAVTAVQMPLTQVSEAYTKAAQAVVDEVAGSGGTGVPGRGDAYWDKVAERDRLEAQVKTLQRQLDALKPQVRQQLEAQDAKKSADQDVQLADLQKQVAGAKNDKAAEIANHEAAVGNSDGILARLAALDRLGAKDPLLGTAHLLLFLFMTALECLPIIFKTMLALGPPSLYERLVALDEEKAEARVRLRMQTEYEEAETMARSALTAAEARAARTLEAESRGTGMVLQAQLAVTRDGVRRWRDEQLRRSAAVPGTGSDAAPLNHIHPGPEPDEPFPFEADLDAELETLEGDMALSGDPQHSRLAGSTPPAAV